MIFLNGQLVPRADPSIHASDRGFLLGDGLFETLPSRDGRPNRLEAHLARLRAGAAVLSIPLPLSPESLEQGVIDILAANGLSKGDAVLRITLTRGPGQRGLLPPADPQPTLLITAARAGHATPEALTAIMASARRNERSPLAQIKSLNYLDNVLTRMEAAKRGADEALLMNTADRLASASSANIFLLRNRTLLTPPPSEGVLPGITRGAVLALAEALDLTAVETPLQRDDLARADEAFLTNSLIGVRPLVKVDDRPVGIGVPGPVTRQLQEAYNRSLVV